MADPDPHRERLIDVLLREQFGAEQPPDLEDRILARAYPSRRRRWTLTATALTTAAAVMLVVGSVLTVGPKRPPRAVPNRLPALPRVQAMGAAASRPLIPVMVRVPVRTVRPFRLPRRIPVPVARVRIPSFNVRFPQFVTPFTTKSKRRNLS